MVGNVSLLVFNLSLLLCNLGMLVCELIKTSGWLGIQQHAHCRACRDKHLDNIEKLKACKEDIEARKSSQ
jgi:hypothetical protein